MCVYFKDKETKKYAYFLFHECRNHPIDFDMMNSKGFLVRSAKGLNDCTGGYNNFSTDIIHTDLRICTFYPVSVSAFLSEITEKSLNVFYYACSYNIGYGCSCNAVR